MSVMMADLLSAQSPLNDDYIFLMKGRSIIMDG